MIKWIPGSQSREGQESFVIDRLKSKKHGYYVEIGGFDAIEHSNTYLLETQYSWSGVSLEIVNYRVEAYNKIRKNPCLLADATTYDIRPYFVDNAWPKQIDYLQVDIEPAYNTLAALMNMPMDYRYSVITFEHDRYVTAENDKYQQIAYDFLAANGYRRVAHNVNNLEDWYVDPTVIAPDELDGILWLEDIFSFIN
jgi:hypothetical protein